MCTSCNLLDEYNLAALKDDCRKCCQEDSGSDSALKVLLISDHQIYNMQAARLCVLPAPFNISF